ncbi:MAG: MarR family transcriptional regulator [Candidatus Eisenbacteria bacterium]|uniref:MarR family transcriptional regulator n=1 Tax=Eiseniibacteriota bacterium TaxID=2212470 RepID=A0A956NG09_UNCEI|nr:MarR family transcriptional regulator [Candidatus Eisenbacteria bacterium]
MALQFLSPVHKATRQIGLYLTPKAEALGFGLPEAHLSSYLLAYGPCAIGELHRVFGLRRSTLTSILDRLEERGLLERSIHPDDRRSFLVELTAAGRKMAAKTNRDVQVLEDAIRERLKPSDIKGFERVMEAIAEATQVEVRQR